MAWRGGSSAGGPCRGGTPTSRRWTSWPICSAAGGGRGSGSRWSRGTAPRPGSRPSHAAAQRAGQLFIQLEADAAIDPTEIEKRIRDELLRLADPGPTPEELSRSRHRLEAAWRWEQEDLAGLAAGLGNAALWGDWRSWPAEHRAAMAVGAAEIRRVAASYLHRGGPDGRLVTTPRRGRAGGRRGAGRFARPGGRLAKGSGAGRPGCEGSVQRA